MTRLLSLPHVIERATLAALTISTNGPPTERSPKSEGSIPTQQVSGTFRIGSPAVPSALQAYLVQESRHKQRAAQSLRMASRTLGELRCPRELRQWAESAVDDKMRHAGALASAAFRPSEGARAQDVEDFVLTDLYGFALENGTERCVSDTYAAARFSYQAQEADTPELAQVFAAIARDDAQHAELFWELQAWALGQLSPARGRMIATEQREVRWALRSAIEAQLPVDLLVYAGVPGPDAAHALMDALEFELWDDQRARSVG